MAKSTDTIRQKIVKYRFLCKESLIINLKGLLVCIFCDIVLNTTRKSNVAAHLATKFHVDRKTSKHGKQPGTTFLNFPNEKTGDVILSGFLGANIPLYKLRYPAITRMFKDMNIIIPS